MRSTPTTRFSTLAILLLLNVAVANAQAPAAQSTTGPTLPFTVSKETTFLTTPLQANGMPDYLTALQAMRDKNAPSTQDNGYALFLSIADPRDCPRYETATLPAKLGITLPADSTKSLGRFSDWLKLNHKTESISEDAADEMIQRASQQAWVADDFPLVAEFLKAQAPLLDTVVKAAEKPSWWAPYMTPRVPFTEGVLLPYLADERIAAISLGARATLRFKAGDFDGAVTDLHAIRQLARKVGKGTLIETLVGAAIDRCASQAVGAVAASGSLTVAQADTLQTKVMQGFAPLQTLVESFSTFERFSGLESIELVALQDKRFLELSWIKPIDGAFDVAHVQWDKVLIRANKLMEDRIAALSVGNAISHHDGWSKWANERIAMLKRVPEYAVVAEAEEAYREIPPLSMPKIASESDDAYTQRVGDVLLLEFFGTVFTSSEKADKILYRAALSEMLATLALDIARYKAVHNKWPDTLAAITPEFIKDLPPDPYSADGKSTLMYVLNKKGFLLYSIGPNNTDDGGILHAEDGFDDIAVGIWDHDSP